MLLGAAAVPLSPLLQGAWVDGYAPVFAIMATSVGGQTQEERVQASWAHTGRQGRLRPRGAVQGRTASGGSPGSP
jgi:hypothetical protein